MPLLKVNQIASYSGNTLTLGTTGDTIQIASGATLLGAGLTTQSVQTTGFTAVKGNLYPCNTTSSAFTVTLPASASVGDQIQLVDYAGTFGTNNLTINPNGLKISGLTSNAVLFINGTAVTIFYIDSTQGWLVSSDGLRSSFPVPYSADILVVAGGGAGGSTGGGGGGAGGYRTSTQNIYPGLVYTATVGAGATGPTGYGVAAASGSNSSITGTGITTITSAGGGGSGGADIAPIASSGGSGGGANRSLSAGSGNTPSTSPSQGNNGGTAINSLPCYPSGGGGGAGAVGGNAVSNTGGNGGNGTASSITGSGVYSGGGTPGTAGSGGTGGGGNGGAAGGNNAGSDGTANLGGGGGGGTQLSVGVAGGSGGSGVVILSVPTSRYSGTTTGSPTVTTSGSNTIIKFTGSGTYTA